MLICVIDLKFKTLSLYLISKDFRYIIINRYAYKKIVNHILHFKENNNDNKLLYEVLVTLYTWKMIKIQGTETSTI